MRQEDRGVVLQVAVLVGEDLVHETVQGFRDLESSGGRIVEAGPRAVRARGTRSGATQLDLGEGRLKMFAVDLGCAE